MKLLRRLVGWGIGVPAALVVVIFAVANRGAVTVDLWPLPWQIDVPLYILVLGSLVIGLLVGGGAVWLSSLPIRRRAKLEHRRADRLEEDLNDLRDGKSVPALGGEPPTVPPLILPGP